MKTHTCMHTEEYAYTCTRTQTHMHTHTYTHMGKHIKTHTCMHTQTYAHTCTHIHTNTHKHRHTCNPTHKHTHTHKAAGAFKGMDTETSYDTKPHCLSSRCRTLMIHVCYTHKHIVSLSLSFLTLIYKVFACSHMYNRWRIYQKTFSKALGIVLVTIS